MRAKLSLDERIAIEKNAIKAAEENYKYIVAQRTETIEFLEELRAFRETYPYGVLIRKESDMADMCGDNRFEIIAKAKADLLEGTNIETDEAEMAVLDNILFRCWQMGWLDRYDTADTPQTDDAYFLKLMSAVERGEISDAGANQAWYEYINHKDEPQTERSE